MNRQPLKPEVVVITGASAGVGRAVAREFGRHGAHVGLIARGEDGLNGAREDVERLGGRALVVPCDVADHAALDAAAERIEQHFGPIDVWINNAMVSVMSPFKLMTLEEFRRVTEVTYLGCVHGTFSALKRMLPRDRGVIVQVGSALAYRSIPLQSAYCGAKHAILGFTESLRTELLYDRSSVQVRMIHLPAVNTTQFEWVRNRMPNRSKPVGRIYQPEVAAEAIYWTAHHDRPEMYLGYPTVQAIVGDKIAPRLADHYVAATVYEGHQGDTPDDPDRPDNLYTPVPGDHGAHGPYDREAVDYSWQWWLTKNRSWLGAAAAGVALVAGATAVLNRR